MLKKIYINLLFIDFLGIFRTYINKKDADCITAPRPNNN